ncbi:MAG: ROK family protein [Candidatus Dadabacteria bacterium]|nr:MAG: ROK family protein [Candidatus Dadabacteria bacterium]
MQKELLWGVDLGGTKTELVVVPQNQPAKPLFRKRIKTPKDQGYQAVLQSVKDLVSQAKKELAQTPEILGIGAPGALDPLTGKVRNSNTLCLNGKPLDQDLKETLQIEKIIIENDANCFALAEAWLGSAKDSSSVFGVIMGTGVGGGLVYQKKIIKGYQGIGGEWGHNTLVENGELCYCGKKGCVETVISGPALEKLYQKKTHKKKSLKEIISAENKENINFLIDHLISYFAKAIAVVINIFDPETVVLGGGLSNINALYSNKCKELVYKEIFHDSPKTKIVKNTLGDSAGVFGAAMLSASSKLN